MKKKQYQAPSQKMIQLKASQQLLQSSYQPGTGGPKNPGTSAARGHNWDEEDF